MTPSKPRTTMPTSPLALDHNASTFEKPNEGDRRRPGPAVGPSHMCRKATSKASSCCRSPSLSRWSSSWWFWSPNPFRMSPTVFHAALYSFNASLRLMPLSPPPPLRTLVSVPPPGGPLITLMRPATVRSAPVARNRNSRQARTKRSQCPGEIGDFSGDVRNLICLGRLRRMDASSTRWSCYACRQPCR